MPIVVNPGFVWPPETEPVVSPDGRITAIVDPAHAGVLLRADYSDQGDSTPVENLWKYSQFSSGKTGMAKSSNYTWEMTGDGMQITGYSDPGTGGQSIIYTVSEGLITDLAPNAPYSWAIPVRNDCDHPVPISVNSWLRDTSGSTVDAKGDSFELAPGETRVARIDGMVGGSDAYDIRWSLYYGSGTPRPQVGDVFTVLDGITCVQSETAPDPFNGDTAENETTEYSWTGPVGNSASLASPIHSRLVAKVRFERQDGSVVRSGDPAWAPGGYAHAYDHEATLGGGTLWRAVPILFDGSEGTPSEYVGAVIPALSDGWAWLKPVADPNKAMLLKVEPPDLSYDGRVDTTSIAGSARPAATWDVLEGFTTQLRSLVREKPVADQLMTLLDEGPVLAQFPSCAGLSDFYFIRGKVDLEHVHWDGYPWRRYQWDVISIDRPDTTDSPLRIPDLSYDTVERDWTTYDQLKSTVVSNNKLLEP